MGKLVWKSGWLSGNRDEFIITETLNKNNERKFTIINTRGDFETSHTHVSSFDTAKTMVTIVSKKLTPKSKSEDFIVSLLRINKSKKYKITLEKHLQEIRKNKKIE